MGSVNIGVLISGPIRPVHSDDIIATAYAREIKGGHHSVETITLRNAIISQRKEVGMLCSVYNDPGFNGTYQLKALPNTWQLFNTTENSSSSWLNSVIDVVDVLPDAPAIGDRYLASTNVSGNLIGLSNTVSEYTVNGWVTQAPDNGDVMVLKSQTNAIWYYTGVFPNGKWLKHLIGGISIKNYIDNEVIEVPENYQYFVYGDLTIDGGQLINYGEVVTLNGDLIILNGGEFMNYGSYISPIVDRKKYAAIITTIPNTPMVLVHNMNTLDVIGALYSNGDPVPIVFKVIDNNTISITTTNAVSGRVTIMG